MISQIRVRMGEWDFSSARFFIFNLSSSTERFLTILSSFCQILHSASPTITWSWRRQKKLSIQSTTSSPTRTTWPWSALRGGSPSRTTSSPSASRATMTCWSGSLGQLQGGSTSISLSYPIFQVGQTERGWGSSFHPPARLRANPQQREVQEHVPQGGKARGYPRDLHVCRLREWKDGLLSGLFLRSLLIILSPL